jgi:hypothetical protein
MVRLQYSIDMGRRQRFTVIRMNSCSLTPAAAQARRSGVAHPQRLSRCRKCRAPPFQSSSLHAKTLKMPNFSRLALRIWL